MRKFIVILFVLYLTLICSCGHQENFQDSLQSLTLAERSFARASADTGMREAFMSFLAEDAIVFRPEPVRGRERYANSPQVPGMLIWQPCFADISRDGRMGYTTGPWEFRKESTTDSADGYGDYISVWKKQKDNSWKVVVDVGISHPQPGYNLREVVMETEYPPIDLSQKVQKIQEIDLTVLLEIDRSFSNQAEGTGIQRAFQSYASPNVRLYRENSLPMVGLEYSLTYLSDLTGTYRWTPQYTDMTLSRDLGYTYGTGECLIESIDSLTVERFSYLRIWKTDNEGSWKMVLEATNPIPPSVGNGPS